MSYFTTAHEAKRLEDVRQFMDTFRQPYPCDNKERPVWLKSEFLECMDAFYDGNAVGVLDGLIDYEYVRLGWKLESNGVIGLTHPGKFFIREALRESIRVDDSDKWSIILIGAWDAVHRANMRKVWTHEQARVSFAMEFALDQHQRFEIHPTFGEGAWDLYPTENGVAVLLNGKVKKPPGWVGPEHQLATLIAMHKSLDNPYGTRKGVTQ